MPQPNSSLDQAYREYPQIETAFQEFLDTSLSPRGPESLFDLLATLDLPSNSLAVDVGCGDGSDSLLIAERFGVRMHGVDPVDYNISVASAAAAEAEMGALMRFEVGSAEALPLPDQSVDLVWCKEVLIFTRLDETFAEFRRVLKPGGSGLAYQVLTGPRMSDVEARQFWEVDLGYGEAHSVRPDDVEAAIVAAGLRLTRRVDFSSEWGEYAQESSGAPGRRLLHAARLLRDRRRYVAEFGSEAYQTMLGDCLWHVYRMIGKLQGAAFVFVRDAASSGPDTPFD
jgi:SAM-dependent methyltransferase